MKPEQNMFTYFGACIGKPYGSYAACEELTKKKDTQCCNFKQIGGTATGQFCVSDAERAGKWTGQYDDHEFSKWQWTCKEPPKPDNTPDNNKPDDKGVSPTGSSLDGLPAWSTYNDTWAEWYLWITYACQFFGFLGLPLGYFLGIIWILYGEIWAAWSLIELIMGKGDFSQWFWGPCIKGLFSQPWIFVIGLYLSFIPLVNLLTAFLFGWWAIADYYSYDYVLFEGPTLP